MFLPVAASVCTTCRTRVLAGSILAPEPVTSSVLVGFLPILTPAVLITVGALAATLVILGSPLGNWVTAAPGAEASGR